jgi:hypothetical protein
MLAATAMVAMLAASLYATLNIAFRARDTATRTVDMTRKCNAAFSFLQADLQAAAGPAGSQTLVGAFLGGQPAASGTPANTPGSGVSSATGVGLGGSAAPGLGAQIANSALSGFSGTGDVLCFYAVAAGMEADYGVGDIKKVEYACVTDPSSRETTLVRRLTTNLLAPTLPAPTEETICTGVRSVTMTYFDGAAWQTDWDSTTVADAMPLAVQVTLQLNIPGASPHEPSYTMTRILPIPRGQGVDPNIGM